MKEEVLVNSYRGGAFKIYLAILYGIPAICFIIYLIGCIQKSRFRDPVTLRMVSGDFSKVFFDGFRFYIPLVIIFVVFLLSAIITTFALTGMRLTVTNMRVSGVGRFHKRVDIPIDAISAVGTSWMKGIEIASSSGNIKFIFIENYDEISGILRQLLNKRQESRMSERSTDFSSVNSVSSADEIKKYKDLYDQGVITEEEYAMKKKQLLGL